MGTASRSAKSLPAEYRRELDKQQNVVIEVQATLECIIVALDEFAETSPQQVPLFSHALRLVVTHLEGVANALYEEELTAAAAEPDSPGQDDD